MDAKTGEMGGCPVDRPVTVRSLLGRTNRDWWPESLPIDILHQGGVSPDPMGAEFDYSEAFKQLEKAAAERGVKLPWFLVDPCLTPIRSDPRFADLLTRTGLPQIAMSVNV